MSVAVEVETIKARARRLYAAGVCPGCGAELVKVAGVGNRHYRAGQEVVSHSGDPRVRVRWYVSPSGLRSGNPVVLTEAGDRATYQVNDSRLCDWTADELTILVHLGSGLVGS